MLLAGATAGAQVVLRDTPRRVAADETPRWLGRTGVVEAANRRVLVDKDLRCIEASEVEFGPEQVRYRDARGRAATMETASLVMVLPPGAEQESGAATITGIEWREIADVTTGPQGRAEMVDGQVIPGKLVVGVPKGEAIAWEHWLLGRVELPIEDLASLVMRAGGLSAVPTMDPSSDTVAFTNGDVARGVVESVALRGEVGELSMDVDGKAFTAPLDRVSAVAFANPPTGPTGVMVWLRDGTVIGGGSVGLDRGAMTLEAPPLVAGRTIEVSWDDVVGVNLDAKAVVPLSSIELAGVQAGEGRTWCVAPRLAAGAAGVGEVELAGPIRAHWNLPVGVRLVSMSVSLPEAARTLGDCVVVAECGGQTVRQRLNGEQPTAEIRLTPANGSTPHTLSLTIESGEGGTIQDRVVLRRALVLVK